MRWLLDIIGGIYTFFTVTIWSTITDFIDWVINLVTVVIPNTILIMLPDGVAEYLRTIDLQGLYEFTEPLTWWFPLWGLTGIYFTAYSAAGSIRLLRFIIGWFPTVEG
ncbi:MAG: hypothetical protein ACX94C_05825 [Phycisphaerales bacterium]